MSDSHFPSSDNDHGGSGDNNDDDDNDGDDNSFGYYLPRMENHSDNVGSKFGVR